MPNPNPHPNPYPNPNPNPDPNPNPNPNQVHRKRAYGAPVDVFAFGVVRRWLGVGVGVGVGVPYISRLQPYISRLQPYHLQVLRKLLSRVQAPPSKGSLLRRICMPAGSQRRLERRHSSPPHGLPSLALRCLPGGGAPHPGGGGGGRAAHRPVGGGFPARAPKSPVLRLLTMQALTYPNPSPRPNPEPEPEQACPRSTRSPSRATPTRRSTAS